MGSAHADESAGSPPAEWSETMKVRDLTGELRRIAEDELKISLDDDINVKCALRMWARWEIGDDSWADQMLALLREMCGDNLQIITRHDWRPLDLGEDGDFFAQYCEKTSTVMNRDATLSVVVPSTVPDEEKIRLLEAAYMAVEGDLP